MTDHIADTGNMVPTRAEALRGLADRVDMDKAARDSVAAVNLVLAGVGQPPVTP